MARPAWNVARCVVCDCHDESPCAGGCSWAMTRPPLCSACVAIGQKIAATIKRYPMTALAFLLTSPVQALSPRRKR